MADPAVSRAFFRLSTRIERIDQFSSGRGQQRTLQEDLITMAQAPSAAQSRKDEVTRLESLANETDTSLNLVKAIYTEELQALEQQARIRTFLTVIAMRRTRLILQDLEAGTDTRNSH